MELLLFIPLFAAYWKAASHLDVVVAEFKENFSLQEEAPTREIALTWPNLSS